MKAGRGQHVSHPSERAQPSLLFAGRGERMTDALRAALLRKRIKTEACSLTELAERAYALAPDAVVLVGDAAEGGGSAAAASLRTRPATAAIPVVLVADLSAPLGTRLDAFRHGVVSVIPRTASVEELAASLAKVAVELPDRPGEMAGGLAAASVDELVELFAEKLRSGILSIAAGGEGGASTQIVLRGDRTMPEVVSDLVERLRPLVSRAEGKPLRYEFFETPHVASLDLDLAPEASIDVFHGRRILLIEQNAARSDVLVQELRAVGAEVVVADGDGNGLARARLLDPEVAVLDGGSEDGWALTALRTLRRDSRLRWTSLAMAETDQLWKNDQPDIARLANLVLPLVRPDMELAARTRAEPSFEAQLTPIGPVRVLRALIDTGLGLRVRIFHPRVSVEIDLAEGLVVGAAAIGVDGQSLLEGAAALATFCALSSGRIQVEHKQAPATTNVMAPLNDAMAAADAEKPLVPPSIPPPSQPPSANVPAISVPRLRVPSIDAEHPEAVVEKLEALLHKLSAIVEQRAYPRPLATTPQQAIDIPPQARRHRQLMPTPIHTGAPPSEARRPDAPVEDDTRPVQLQRSPKSTLLGMTAPPILQQNEPAPSAQPAVPVRQPPREPALAPVQSPPEPAPLPQPSPQPVASRPEAAPARASVAPISQAAVREKSPWRLVAFIALSLLLLGGATGAGVFFLVGNESAIDEVASPEVSTSAPTSVPADPEPPPAEVEEAPPEEVEAPSPPPRVMGPGPDDPLEGNESDFSLEAIGITVAPPTRNDRGRARTVEMLIRTGNQMRRSPTNRPQAETIYRRVLTLDPENPRATAAMARVHLDRGEHAQAVLFAQRLVRLRPLYPANYVFLGDVFEAAGNHNAAIRAWSRSLELNPRWSSARERLRLRRDDPIPPEPSVDSP